MHMLVVIAAASVGFFAQPQPDVWALVQRLTGEWIGEGGGAPGQASAGSFSFSPDLQGQVLIRRSFAEYAATKERPAFRHDDLTVIYREDDVVRATFFDNERHVIHYTVEVSPDSNRIVWISARELPGPRFRFTYTFTDPNHLKLAFEIAPPGKPDEFKAYVEGTAWRKSPAQ